MNSITKIMESIARFWGKLEISSCSLENITSRGKIVLNKIIQWNRIKNDETRRESR